MTEKNKLNNRFSLFILLFFLGLMVSVQFTSEGSAGYLEQQDPQDLVAMWKDLNMKKDSLQQEIARLNRQKITLTRENTAGLDALSNMTSQLATLYKINGIVAVKGPGIRITIPKSSPLLYIDLVDIVNELWASGAEAVAVNKHRVVNSTSFYYAENDSGIFITVDKHKLNYPIVIEAIGDPATLEKGLTFPGGIIDNLNTIYQIFPRVERVQEILLPPSEKQQGNPLTIYSSRKWPHN